MKQQGYFKRGKKLYVRGYVEDNYIRAYSTGLSATKENKLYLDKHWYEVLTRIYNEKNTPLSATMSVCEYCEDFLLNHQARDTTIDIYTKEYNKKVKPFFKNYSFEDMKRLDLKNWQNDLKNRGISTTAARAFFNQVLNEAVKDELLSVNYLATIDKIPSKKRDEKIPSTLGEIETILNGCDGQLHNLIKFAYFTGLRTSEIIGLRWENVSIAKDNKVTINIQDTVTSNGGYLKNKTKNNASKRTLILQLPAQIAIIDQSKLKRSSGKDFVFHQNNTYINISSLKHKWYKLLKKVGIEDKRCLYWTRHTFASMMIGNGMPIMWVSRYLGHSDTNTTFKSYAKFIKNDEEPEATFLNDMFKNKHKNDHKLCTTQNINKDY